MLLALTPLFAQTIQVSWSLNPESDIQSYHIYRASTIEEEMEIAQVSAADSVYMDSDISLGEEYTYRIVAVDASNNFGEFSDPVYVVADIRSATENAAQQPFEFKLERNYPNPFNPTTTISYSVAEQAHVSLVIYDVLGRAVKTLVNENRVPGVYDIVWDATDETGNSVATGLYFARFAGGDYQKSIKLAFKK